MSIMGKLGDEMRAEGYATTAETLRRFKDRPLIESTLQSWCSKGVVDSLKVGRFLWVKTSDVEARLATLEDNKAKMLKTNGDMNAVRWGTKPQTPDAPPPALEVKSERLHAYTLEELREVMKDACREVLREFGLVS